MYCKKFRPKIKFPEGKIVSNEGGGACPYGWMKNINNTAYPATD